MKKVLSILLFFAFLLSYSQQRITIPQAINIISKQSMLSQRMAKDKIYTDNTKGEDTQRGLISSVVQFENNLSSLKGMSLPDDIQKEITHIELLWIGYKQSIMDEQGDSNDEIMDYNNVVLTVTETVFSKLLDIAKKENSYPYNTNDSKFGEAYIAANNLKHTAQRLALYYTAYFYKISKYDNPVFEKIVSDIESQVTSILDIKNKNVEYADNTDKIDTEWKNIKSILEDVRNKKFISVHTSPKPEVIYEGSNKLLKYSDLLSRTYKAVNEINN
ncbi:hypothetical protein ACXGQW_07720 [Wenyingzhuangia sp. IMCC45533]